MELDEIRTLLDDMNLRAIAEATGVSYNKLTRLANGSAAPRYDTVIRVIKYLETTQIKAA